MPQKRRSSRLSAPRKQDALATHFKWLKRAEAIAARSIGHGGSPHPTVKVGAVLVDSKGLEIAASSNRFPQGVDRRRPERYRDGSKSLWINCAEQMVIAEALKAKKSIQGATLYVTLEPCAVCAGLIAELGLKKVCVPVGALRRYARLKAKWKHSIEIGLTKLAEAEVQLISIDMT